MLYEFVFKTHCTRKTNIFGQEQIAFIVAVNGNNSKIISIKNEIIVI